VGYEKLTEQNRRTVQGSHSAVSQKSNTTVMENDSTLNATNTNDATTQQVVKRYIVHIVYIVLYSTVVK